MFAVVCHCSEYVTITYHDTLNEAIMKVYDIVNPGNVWNLDERESNAVLTHIREERSISDHHTGVMHIVEWTIASGISVRHAEETCDIECIISRLP